MNDFNNDLLIQHIEMILDATEDGRITEETLRNQEVHQEVFNTDYFIIGYYKGEEWIKENFSSIYKAIDLVRDYENSNFGEFTTNINGEAIANTLSYIIGEVVLNELYTSELTVESLKRGCLELIEDLK